MSVKGFLLYGSAWRSQSFQSLDDLLEPGRNEEAANSCIDFSQQLDAQVWISADYTSRLRYLHTTPHLQLKESCTSATDFLPPLGSFWLTSDNSAGMNWCTSSKLVGFLDPDVVIVHQILLRLKVCEDNSRNIMLACSIHSRTSLNVFCDQCPFGTPNLVQLSSILKQTISFK
ncbi:hypothetical protein ILYODFUR_025001 [Ilyodon furcidens]|uniref:Uncharacterized protein n=1 Tax=Ilyodon furcidens TaxID=33524 RepID=A0ABV0UUY0_9TELE